MTSPARERCYSAWAAHAPDGTSRVVFDSKFDLLKDTARDVLRARDGRGATLATLGRALGSPGLQIVIAVLQELCDEGRAREGGRLDAAAYVYVPAPDEPDRQTWKKYRATAEEHARITELLEGLRRDAKRR